MPYLREPERRVSFCGAFERALFSRCAASSLTSSVSSSGACRSAGRSGTSAVGSDGHRVARRKGLLQRLVELLLELGARWFLIA